MTEAITDGIKVALRYHEVIEHVPATAADAARAAAGSHNTDLLVAVGGFRRRLAKAIALPTDFPSSRSPPVTPVQKPPASGESRTGPRVRRRKPPAGLGFREEQIPKP